MPRILVAMFLLATSGRIAALSLLTYNVAGNGVADWSTNSAQVQAIGRQMAFLQPDVITFNEIPFTNTWRMPSFVAAFLPGYFLATNSGTDGFIRSVVVSRHPIVRSKSWLDSADLSAFGYAGANFTRDLFEAEIEVPGFEQHLHVFVTHLKAAADADSSARRAAEASAISNFFVRGFLTTNSSHPYVLAGDMNEDVTRPPSNSGNPIARLVNAATGLQLTTPTNPVTRGEFTFSIRGTLNRRIDYVLPGSLLASNIASSQVFRSDALSPMPTSLQSTDSRTASDHLPVLTIFNNPYDTAFRLTSIRRTNDSVELRWQSAAGKNYAVETSSDLNDWVVVATNLVGSSTNGSWNGIVAGPSQFFRVRRTP